MHGKENNYENAFIVSFLLLTHTHRNMKVAIGQLMLKCGRRVTGEATIQTLTSCALLWQKLKW
jgi:hypothetical protein